jgi:uncharacterized protein (TIGR03084 family)
VTTIAEALADWRAELKVLDDLLATFGPDDWSRETLAQGWDSRDTVGHLADTNDIMYRSITGEGGGLMEMVTEVMERAERPGLSGANSPETVDLFTAWQIERVRRLDHKDVYEWWQTSSKRLADSIEELDPSGRYSWGPNMVSPLSLISARTMETWAHSLDIHGAAGVAYEDTDRLKHIAFLGHRALPYAFQLEGLDAPGPIRVELTSPSGELWTFGPEDAPTRITGAAGDWSRLVARRDRDGAASRLTAEGPDAANAIEHGRAFL